MSKKEKLVSFASDKMITSQSAAAYKEVSANPFYWSPRGEHSFLCPPPLSFKDSLAINYDENCTDEGGKEEEEEKGVISDEAAK